MLTVTASRNKYPILEYYCPVYTAHIGNWTQDQTNRSFNRWIEVVIHRAREIGDELGRGFPNHLGFIPEEY